MTALADKLVHSRSGLAHQIDLLKKAGSITRAPNPEDKRSTIVSITDAGRSVVEAVMPGHIAIAREMFLDQLDSHGLDALSSTLPSVARKMRSATQARSQRPRK